MAPQSSSRTNFVRSSQHLERERSLTRVDANASPLYSLRVRFSPCRLSPEGAVLSQLTRGSGITESGGDETVPLQTTQKKQEKTLRFSLRTLSPSRRRSFPRILEKQSDEPANTGKRSCTPRRDYIRGNQVNSQRSHEPVKVQVPFRRPLSLRSRRPSVHSGVSLPHTRRKVKKNRRERQFAWER